MASTPDQRSPEAREALPDGWTRAQPTRLPRPTYWPAALALGIVLLLSGALTSWMLSLTGLLLMVLSLGGWVRELLLGSMNS